MTRTSISSISSAFALLLIVACTPSQPQTGLFEKGQHAGTATVLRVDDSWRGSIESRAQYHLGDGVASKAPRFVPLRFKEEVAGLDTPDRIVTDQDYVTITLKSVFIKYFKAISISHL